MFISHPIQTFSPLFSELAKLVDVKVFYYSDFGLRDNHIDPGFGVSVKWDVPLLEGYQYEFLKPIDEKKKAALKFPLVNRGLWKAISEEKWDYILVFGYSYLSNWIVWLFANYLNIPILLISDSELLHKRNPFRIVIKEIPIRLFMRSIKIFFAVGDNNKEYAKRYGVPEEKIFLTGLPVDIKRFREYLFSSEKKGLDFQFRKKYGIPENAKVVVFCGKFIDNKRPLDLVAALNLISIESQIIGLFIGEGPLKKSIITAGGDRVRVTGFINQKEIPIAIGSGNILVVPSNCDPHPLVVTEAASLGIPSIVSDKVGCVGPNDVIRNGETGLIYQCGNIPELSNTISLLLEDHLTYDRMSKACFSISETQSASFISMRIFEALLSLKA